VTTWADGPLVAFDLETTGVDVETARIVTASTVHITPGEPLSSYDVLVNPGIDIPAEATAVHGITTEHAREEGCDPESVVGYLSAVLADALEAGSPLVIYNAPFDLAVLDRECRRHEVPTLHERCADDGLALFVVDPLVIDKACDRYRKGSRKLADVAAHYGVTLSEADAHTSAGDALAAARLAWVLARRFPEIGRMTPAELMEWQAGRYANAAASFEDYLRQRGKLTEPVSRDWPVRRAVANA
jgi:DNA polymerase III subunit epsilon